MDTWRKDKGTRGTEGQKEEGGQEKRRKDRTGRQFGWTGLYARARRPVHVPSLLVGQMAFTPTMTGAWPGPAVWAQPVSLAFKNIHYLRAYVPASTLPLAFCSVYGHVDH